MSSAQTPVSKLRNVVRVDTERSLVSRPLRVTEWPECVDDTVDLVFQVNAIHVVDRLPAYIASDKYTFDIVCGTASTTSTGGGAVYDTPYDDDTVFKNKYRTDATCTVLLLGIDRGGHSVALHVTGFAPYFYVELNTAHSHKQRVAHGRALRKYVAALCRVKDADIGARIEMAYRAFGFAATTAATTTTTTTTTAAEPTRRRFPFLRLSFPTTVAFERARKNLLNGEFEKGREVAAAAGDKRKYNHDELAVDDDDDDDDCDDCDNDGTSNTTRLCQENVSFSTQFALVANIVASEWVSVERNKHQLVTDFTRVRAVKYTHCAVERTAALQNVGPYIFNGAINGDPLPSVPFVVTSFDIEAYAEPDVNGSYNFPNPKHTRDCVTVVSSVSRSTDAVVHATQGYDRYTCVSLKATEVERYVLKKLVYDRLDPRLRIDVVGCEREMIDRTRDYWTYVIGTNCLTGYNIWGFDLNFLWVRAQFCGARRYGYGGQLIFEQTPLKELPLSSSALGDNVFLSNRLTGVVVTDMMFYIKTMFKPKSLTLKKVAVEFLPDMAGKIDLTPREQFACYENGTLEAYERYIEYCDRDAVLPLELMWHGKISYMPNLVAMSRVAHTPLQDLISRGQQEKTYNLLLYYANALFDAAKNGGQPRFVWNRRTLPSYKYDGAVVIPPVRGFYEEPIATLDFASMYPSIMRQFALCPSNYVMPGDVRNGTDAQGTSSNAKCFPIYKDSVDASAFGNGGESDSPPPVPVREHRFMQRSDGIVPTVLERLANERKRVKTQMKQYSASGGSGGVTAAAASASAATYAMLDGVQLSLKITMNSVYGFFGAREHGRSTCLPISETTTSEGRRMLYETKRLVERWYPAILGDTTDTRGTTVVYGDTDSVMVRFAGVTPDWAGVEHAFRCMYEAAARITAHFGGVVALEGEKIYWPFYLMRKKRYLAIKYERCLAGSGVRDVKGFDTQRRDTVDFVARVLKDMLAALLEDRSPPRAISILRETLKRLNDNALPIVQYVMSKSLKSTYKNAASQVQAVVNDKVRKRAPGTEKRPGDRVEYVVVEGDAKSKMRVNASGALYDRAEDPAYVEASAGRIKIDRLWYVEKCLRRPVRDLLGPLLDAATIVDDDGSGGNNDNDDNDDNDGNDGNDGNNRNRNKRLKSSEAGKFNDHSYPNTDRLIETTCRALFQQRNGMQDIQEAMAKNGDRVKQILERKRVAAAAAAAAAVVANATL